MRSEQENKLVVSNNVSNAAVVELLRMRDDAESMNSGATTRVKAGGSTEQISCSEYFDNAM